MANIQLTKRQSWRPVDFYFPVSVSFGQPVRMGQRILLILTNVNLNFVKHQDVEMNDNRQLNIVRI